MGSSSSVMGKLSIVHSASASGFCDIIFSCETNKLYIVLCSTSVNLFTAVHDNLSC